MKGHVGRKGEDRRGERGNKKEMNVNQSKVSKKNE